MIPSLSSYVSNISLQVGEGPILFNNIYLGEVYDANLEQDGWSETGFDDVGWPTAVYNVLNDKSTRMIAQYAPPIRMGDIIPSVAQKEVFPNMYVTKVF